MENDIFKYGHNIEWSLPVLYQQEVVWTTIYNALVRHDIVPPKVNAFGCPTCAWAGGRIPVLNKPDLKISEKIFNYMKSCNATPTFTFTYTGLQEEHLKDTYCNELLDFALEHNAKFIVYSDLLRDYIKEKSPEAFVTASVIKATNVFQRPDKIAHPSPEEEAEFYNKLLKKYDMVVVRPEFSRSTLIEHPEYIDDISRIEVLINQTCVQNCPWAMEHYHSYELHKEGFDPSNPPFKCFRSTFKDPAGNYKNNLIHTYDQVSKLVNEHGVRHLKLQGRGYLKPRYLEKIYLFYTQIFKTEGDSYMILKNLNKDLKREVNYFKELTGALY